MKLIARILMLLWFLGSGGTFAQSSCGFFDPKVTFADGTKACLSEFSFFSRQGLLTSFRNHIELVRAHQSYAIATPAKPASCPFVRFTSWDQAGQEGAHALPRCQQRLDEASRGSAELSSCRCEVLIDSGTTKLSRAEFTQRLASFEHFFQFGMTQDQTRKVEEAKQAKKEKAEKQARQEVDDKNQKPAPPKQPPVVVTDPSPSKSPPLVFANRKALVIGNDSYRHAEVLKTARADAGAIAEGLKKVGYSVTLLTDLPERQMKSAIRTFASQIQGGDEVTFFFAGHGVEINNVNYLIPIDITGENPLQIRDEAVDLKRVLDDISDRRAKFTLAVIDACRNNPFGDKRGTRMAASSSRGLAPTTPATGQMIIYSAGKGQLALDSLGDRDPIKNGVFTRVFIQQMQRPSVSIDKIARDTRSEVVRLASTIGHEQVPAIYDQVIGEFFFLR